MPGRFSHIHSLGHNDRQRMVHKEECQGLVQELETVTKVSVNTVSLLSQG